MILEIAANSVSSAMVAQYAGADRVEFFSNLAEGGTTPSYGQLKLIKEKISIPVYVMLRPRGGDFFYTDLEFEEMLHDLALIKQMGFAGVVFGILTQEGDLDITRNKTLVELAKPLSCTLHRAFDRTKDPVNALEDAIKCGFERILTSGQKHNALAGADLIREFVEQAGARIKILAGTGITPENVAAVISGTGVREIHSTAKAVKSSAMLYQNPAMPAEPQYTCSTEIVKALKEIIVA